MDETGGLQIEATASATDEVRILIGELDQALSAHYPAGQRHGLALDALFQPHIRFFLARLGGVAVGCGGIAFFRGDVGDRDGFAEVKRMYVRQGARGHGIAAALLRHLEQQARDAGVSVLRLETGEHQHAAMRLYEREGFRVCHAFGAYAAMPADGIATSVFFEKFLAATI